ncbi:MarR family winged helix-turn-helix transcriptional regulator [Nocardioides dongkuii]|uniref:MarR family winged helix-turn-helix transcriptional regulator n=1 Tax=Nocardioides dongkuii TaxID=2760089 RepID=UPI001C7080A6|nr:MarR family transcriptional regulator [Nocardioides dongkuii]
MAGPGVDVEDAVLRDLGAELMRLSLLRTAAHPGLLLEVSAFRVLWMLVEHGPRTLRELADDLHLERSTVTRQVNAAIARGLVERYDEAGSGGRLLRPTDAGRAAYEHDGRLRAAVLVEALSELGPGGAGRVVRELRAFNDALDRTHARGGR